MATRVDLQGAIRKIHALANVLHRPLKDVLDSGGRVAAISLAKSTQPSRGEGTGFESQEIGEKAVAGDIYKIYGNAGEAWEAIRDPRLRGAFWANYKKGDYNRAEEIANDAGIEVGDFDGGTLHKSIRRTRRPVVSQKKPRYFIIRPSARRSLERYVKLVQGDVGTAKGGWADAARQLGSIRGLRTEGDITANWITRRGHGYGQISRSGSENHPIITLTNQVPYVDQLLSNSAKNFAITVAHKRTIKNLQIAIKSEVSSLRTAA